MILIKVEYIPRLVQGDGIDKEVVSEAADQVEEGKLGRMPNLVRGEASGQDMVFAGIYPLVESYILLYPEIIKFSTYQILSNYVFHH